MMRTSQSAPVSGDEPDDEEGKERRDVAAAVEDHRPERAAGGDARREPEPARAEQVPIRAGRTLLHATPLTTISRKRAKPTECAGAIVRQRAA